MNMVESVFLIRCSDKKVIWTDSDLELGDNYFLAFSHLGTNVTKTSLPTLLAHSGDLIPLFTRKLYARKPQEEFHIAVRIALSTGAGNIRTRKSRGHQTRSTDRCP